MNFAQGFLSEPLDEVRDTIRERYAPWRSALLALNEECVALQHELTVNRNEARPLLAAVLYARTLASTQGAVLLLEHGLVAQAKSVLRSSLESLFALGAIAERAELAVHLAQTQEVDKRSLADKMLQWTSPLLRGSLPDNTDEATLRALTANRTPELKAYQLAEAAGMMDWYLSMYALLSIPAHSSVSDLVSHLVTDELGNITDLKNEPQVEEQESAWVYAIEIQLRAAKFVNAIFGRSIVDIERHENALRCLG